MSNEFPKIESPCPLRVAALPSAGRDFCSSCERTVHNLSAMSSEQRRTFMSSCDGKVCVAYSVPVSALRVRSALAARVGLAMAMFAAPAFAADTGQETAIDTAPKPASLLGGTVKAPDCDEAKKEEQPVEPEMLMVLGGGISSARDAQWFAADEAVAGDIPAIAEDAFLDERTPVEFGPAPAE